MFFFAIPQQLSAIKTNRLYRLGLYHQTQTRALPSDHANRKPRRYPGRQQNNLIVRNGKSEAKVTNNKRLCSRYCTVEARPNYGQARSIARPLCDSRAFCGLAASSHDFQ